LEFKIQQNLQDIQKVQKHRKAEELINKGIEIRILSEKDFQAIAND